MRLTEFETAYLECALWSTTDQSNEQGGDPLDANYDIYDIEPSSLTKLIDDCRRFGAQCAGDLEAAGLDDRQAGHDFWLTRNGHGAGFWDRGLGDVGERLSKAAEEFGEVYLYVGDDGQVYTS